MEQLNQHIESLIFTADRPISIKEIQSVLQDAFETKFKLEDLEQAIQAIKEKFEEAQFSFQVHEIAEGYQFLSKPAYHNTIGVYLKQKTKRRLSKSALETISIIAYKQPVTKSELERIRGVSCDYAIQKLLEKELVSITGRSEGPGRPLLYGTSDRFMDYFGLKSIRDLPTPKDFKLPDSTIGEAAPIEESAQSEEE
ncbi:MAG: SMC-Scp complex subunit ScpB [Bacteroidota bacterium]